MELTEEQQSEVCSIIGDWYIDWKDKIAHYDSRTHSLGFAKEDLKRRICGD